MTTPSYVHRLIEAHDAGKLPRGSVSIAIVEHDDACDIFDGRSCNCDSDLRIVALEVIAKSASA